MCLDVHVNVTRPYRVQLLESTRAAARTGPRLSTVTRQISCATEDDDKLMIFICDVKTQHGRSASSRNRFNVYQ